MAERMNDNPDLAWDFGKSLDRQRAMAFILQFEATLCVYSASVRQLYSSYKLYFSEDFSRRIVVLPDPGAFHDTFNRIDEESVLATGLYIVPGELIGRQGLHLANVDSERRLGRLKLPFAPAMQAIIERCPAEDPFLPVLVRGDLREYNDQWPILHLHRIRPHLLTDLSALDRYNLATAISEKLETLLLSLRPSKQARGTIPSGVPPAVKSS
jgi:hypothetical protein